jgi:glycosyltransferase involved in cell wall biosynthesis
MGAYPVSFVLKIRHASHPKLRNCGARDGADSTLPGPDAVWLRLTNGSLPVSPPMSRTGTRSQALRSSVEPGPVPTAPEAVTDLDVAMLYYDPHRVHRGFAEAVGADLVDYRAHSAGLLSGTVADDLVNGTRIPDYDVLIVEGSVPLYTALVARARTDVRVVYLCADHGFYELGRGDFSGSSLTKTLVGRFGRPAVSQVGRRGIDGVVAVSEFAAEYTRPIVGAETPLEVAHPYVESRLQAELAATDVSLASTTAVAVGQGAHYKGFDLLVDAWPTVRRHHPDAELHLVGSDHPQSYADTAGVVVHGYVDSLSEALSHASLYVQPSRMDAFPVSTLEAMCAGLPTLVTESTGTRSEAGALDSSLVVQPTASALAEGVSRYFDRPLADRLELSGRARDRGAQFDEQSQRAAFQRAFASVLEELA